MRPRRLAEFEYCGEHRYFVTCCTHRRQRLFVTTALVTPLTSRLLESCRSSDFELLGYVFMPDHLHFLVAGRSERAHLPRLLRIIRQRLTVEFHAHRPGPLWQDGYYERVLRQEEASARVLDYMLGNPVRAGLVANAMDYPFSWSAGHVDFG